MEAFTGKSACIKLDVSTTYFLIKQYNKQRNENRAAKNQRGFTRCDTSVDMNSFKTSHSWSASV